MLLSPSVTKHERIFQVLETDGLRLQLGRDDEMTRHGPQRLRLLTKPIGCLITTCKPETSVRDKPPSM